MTNKIYQASYRIVLALVRVLLDKGVAYGEFAQLIRRAYVQAAEERLMATEGKATTSRIAIMTGLTRKEVGQIRKDTVDAEVDSGKFNRSVRVISGWITDQEFISDEGHPRALPILGEQGSFASLVNRYSGDMPHKAMLDELQRVGVLEVIGDDHVALLRHAFIPIGDDESNLQILGEDVSLLISTIHHNLNAEAGDSLFQRKVSYDNLPPECLPEFKQMVGQQGQHLLEKLNAYLSEQDKDISSTNTDAKRMKAGVGIFYFEEPVAAEPAKTESANTKSASAKTAQKKNAGAKKKGNDE